MNAKEIYDILKNEFSDNIISLTDDGTASEPFIVITPDNLLDIMLFLRDDERTNFDYLSCLSGVDNKETLGVVYNLFSMNKKHRITIKVEVPKDKPEVHTVERVWRSADWHEREAYDMYGIVFKEHHDLRRILNPYDWEGHPLRKDYKQPDEYHGIKVQY
ncbi:MAG: NADH-quinone oxidoreductase subunit C [Candidatus Kapaibacteriota bacterium]